MPPLLTLNTQIRNIIIIATVNLAARETICDRFGQAKAMRMQEKTANTATSGDRQERRYSSIDGALKFNNFR
jgi:hypothetical protein